MPFCRSLYSRYFSTISESSLCALAVFWYFDESLITSGDARALVNSSYFVSIWFNRSNMVPSCSHNRDAVRLYDFNVSGNGDAGSASPKCSGRKKRSEEHTSELQS